MSENTNVIGEGTYGCVHKPSLKCKNKPGLDYKNKVSKKCFKPCSNWFVLKSCITLWDTLDSVKSKTNFSPKLLHKHNRWSNFREPTE